MSLSKMRVLPAVAALDDGRFALRIGVRAGDSVHTWEVRALHTNSGETAAPTGWCHVTYLSDEEVRAAGGTPVEPLVDVAVLADELEETGQYAAARLVRQRIGDVRRSWVGQ